MANINEIKKLYRDLGISEEDTNYDFNRKPYKIGIYDQSKRSYLSNNTGEPSGVIR